MKLNSVKKSAITIGLFTGSMIPIIQTISGGRIDWLIVLLLFLTVTFFAYKVINSYVQKRIKLMYRTIQNQKLEGKDSYDIESSEEDVKKWLRERQAEMEHLKDTEQFRRDFLGNVSHELKTPLFTVQGYIETLLDGAINDKNVRDKYLNRASKGVERLSYILKDLDMITKLEVGDLSLDYEKFDIIELVQNVFDLYEMKAAKKQITLTFDTDYPNPVYVNADKDRIQQILSNLLVNSIKYGLERGTTEISIENLIKNKVIVRVTDNGEGISKEHISRLFERFYRVDKSGSRKEGGSGLGLSIVKHIIEAHNERIYVESEIGVGSEFSFTLEKAK